MFVFKKATKYNVNKLYKIIMVVYISCKIGLPVEKLGSAGWLAVFYLSLVFIFIIIRRIRNASCSAMNAGIIPL